MALDFTILCPKIERTIDEVERDYQATQGLILTEDDLKCILYKKLTALRDLSRPIPTQDGHILATHVHAEVSWYGEDLYRFQRKRRKLAIKPDITVLDPEHLSIIHGYIPLLRPRSTPNLLNHTKLPIDNSYEVPPLPRKQFEFGGKAITFELKFARQGITPRMLTLIKDDYSQIMRLFRILDSRGESHSIFSYLIIFDKYEQDLNHGSFADFLNRHGSSDRHKVIYKTGRVTREYV